MTTRSGKLNVLLLRSPESECASLLEQVVWPYAELTSVTNLSQCVQMLEMQPSSAELEAAYSMPGKKEHCTDFDVVLVECRYPGGMWKDAVQLIRRKIPEMPVIVVCRTGGEPEWVEVLQAGAFDMISAPFCQHELLATLARAAAVRAERESAQTS